MKCGIALDEFLCTIAVDISVRLWVRMQLLYKSFLRDESGRRAGASLAHILIHYLIPRCKCLLQRAKRETRNAKRHYETIKIEQS
jgi:hypothetical protein